MKVELKDLGFIDRVAMAIMSSKLTNMNMAQDQIESLATTSYIYATIVNQVRENFKKEHGVEEVCVRCFKALTEEDIENPTAEDLRAAYWAVAFNDKGEWQVEKLKDGEPLTVAEKKVEEKVEDKEEIESKKEEVAETEIKLDNESTIEISKPRSRGRPKAIKSEVKVSAETEKPKRGRKPKAILKINKILDKK
jgi:hypothetical protein